jgi:hypothetical protein
MSTIPSRAAGMGIGRIPAPKSVVSAAMTTKVSPKVISDCGNSPLR